MSYTIKQQFTRLNRQRLMFLVPYSYKTVKKNKETRNVFDNCELYSISKALISPCGVLDGQKGLN